jgi:DNA processing protein
MEGQLVLVSPYDPGAGFNVGNAMQRNKLIYALADAALVVNSDFEKGGTWTGAVEQLDKLKLVPGVCPIYGGRKHGTHRSAKQRRIPLAKPRGCGRPGRGVGSRTVDNAGHRRCHPN